MGQVKGILERLQNVGCSIQGREKPKHTAEHGPAGPAASTSSENPAVAAVCVWLDSEKRRTARPSCSGDPLEAAAWTLWLPPPERPWVTGDQDRSTPINSN